MTSYKPYIIAYSIFLVCLFTSPKIYSFFDVHLSDPYEHYELDRRDWERNNPGEFSFMSYGEWLQNDQEREKGLLQEFGQECASAFDPWYEPTRFERDFGREE